MGLPLLPLLPQATDPRASPQRNLSGSGALLQLIQQFNTLRRCAPFSLGKVGIGVVMILIPLTSNPLLQGEGKPPIYRSMAGRALAVDSSQLLFEGGLTE